MQKTELRPTAGAQLGFWHEGWRRRPAGGAGILACQFTGHPRPVFQVPERAGPPSARAAGMPPERSGWKPDPPDRRLRFPAVPAERRYHALWVAGN